MEIKIEGNPGTGNTYQEINIQHVDNFNPNATTVINNYGAREGNEDGENMKKDGMRTSLRNTMKEPEENVDITPIRKEILNYVSRVRLYLKDEWKARYMKMWDEILDLKEIETIVYNPGKQKGTNFNRALVAQIIHYLDGHEVYKGTYSPTAMAETLEGDKDHSVRGALGKYPPDNIVSRLDRFMETFLL